MIANYNSLGKAGVVVYGDAICVGDATDVTLQQVSLVDGAFYEFALDLNTVVDAEEDLEFFCWCCHLDLCRPYIFAAQENAGLTVEQDALGGVGDCCSQMGVLLDSWRTDIVEHEWKI